MTRKYDEQLYATKSDNLDEINKCPKRPKLSKWTEEERDQARCTGLLCSSGTHRGNPVYNSHCLAYCPMVMSNFPPFFCLC